MRSTPKIKTQNHNGKEQTASFLLNRQPEYILYSYFPHLLQR